MGVFLHTWPNEILVDILHCPSIVKEIISSGFSPNIYI